ncbi:Ribosomal protein L14, bacterial-type domain-containing protein [Rozella allomycis CSF55]|uniref:Ribosomal protein L14, bacterial-type domain-containing protein n=1 Tax=Rozella allomycis (strain CSF55) TaxID=988480 RepID=A0A075AYZ1_ROZAC|nr:Ribosomal protein L14, bacterial-type domain-containing protein [Rozella allomycis CSF55]|eukprot:EPZ35520.1 Ribosomal protein L14, bacterial-type domain-containing protein [Rozella allomycis CSF55]
MLIGITRKKKVARIGDVITVTVKETHPNAEIKPGEVHKALVIRTRKEFRRENGSYVRFGDNAAVLLGKDYKPLFTRVFGPVTRELRYTRYVRVMSMAPVVL